MLFWYDVLSVTAIMFSIVQLFRYLSIKSGIKHTNRPTATDNNSDCLASGFNFGIFCPPAIRQFEGMMDFTTRVLKRLCTNYVGGISYK